MYSYGLKSTQVLETCHPDLVVFANELIKYVDVSLVFGHRSPELQNSLWRKGRDENGDIIDIKQVVTYKDGYEKLSKHNSDPSDALDLIPYPSGWKDESQMYYVGGIAMVVAKQLYELGEISTEIEWGGQWSSFVDLPHFQRKTIR